MARFDLRKYALEGARSRAEELRSELNQIYRAFPELGSGERKRKSSSPTKVRQRRSMTAAQRKAVSARMKKYWASRRKSKE